ncbi:hypothetical protein BHE74_00036941 [Ensete ventricosum]|nr:hypothetical protein BHE74_00036941 [Ensete ventricosum]
MPPCLLSKHCWFKPVYANSPTIVSTQRAFIVTVTGHLPEVLTAPVAYHAIVLRRSFRGPRVVRGCRDVATRSTPPEKTFSRLLIRVSKMRSCNEPSGCSEDRLVFDQGERELIRPSSGIRN